MIKKQLPDGLHIDTLAVRAGIDPSQYGENSEALYLTSGFLQPDAATAARRFAGTEEGFTYGRTSNPTVTAFENRLAALEGTEAAIGASSGMGAILMMGMGLLKAGDHVICSRSMFGSTINLFAKEFAKFGVQTSFVSQTDVAEWRAAVKPTTRLLFAETPTNPLTDVCDIQALANLAHKAGVRDVAVDSTFATPLSTKPLELGADFVVHSLTKYIGGHGDAMGGAVIGRKTDLDDLNLEATVHFGGILSPFNAWLILRGSATLPLRMRAHEEAALKVARYLEQHPAVTRVLYPGLPSHPQHELARRQMKNFSGMMTFQTHEPGHLVAARMVERLKVVHYAVSLGHHRSLVYWIGTDDIQASTFRHDPEQLRRYRDYAGDGVFRLSVGIENADDLISDLSRVL